MTKTKLFGSVIGILILALALGAGIKLLPGPAPASAARLFKYKVVSTGSANTVYEYEKQLNDMAFQGWEFDHMIPGREWAVFRK
jgi:hypothetical protein